MGNICYKPLIEDMVWSYSRADTFEDCPHRWFLRYIKGHKDIDMFYASYGKFMHKLIEQYYRGEITKEQMLRRYYADFRTEVVGYRPKESIVKSYIDGGADYLRSFSEFPFNMVDVERYVEFSIDGIPFVGYIDYVGEKDGEFYIVDNKSRNMKPRSKRKKPTKNDAEIDKMLRQLYIYSVAIEQTYGKLPKALCLNCFRSGTFIEEPFDNDAFENAKQWAVGVVRKAEQEQDFNPVMNMFGCFWICGVHNHCESYINDAEERRWNKLHEN